VQNKNNRLEDNQNTAHVHVRARKCNNTPMLSAQFDSRGFIKQREMQA